MAVSIVASTTGTTTATLPAGTVSGDIVVVFAYASGTTAPTLPASWTNVASNAVTMATRMQWRVYDGVWAMPTFTNAARCHAITLRGQHATTPIGANQIAGGTNSVITWAVITLQDTSGASALLRGAAHNRPDIVIPVSTNHTGLQGEGIQPGFRTQYKTSTLNGASATSTVSRSDLFTQCTVEIKAATVAQQFPADGTVAATSDATGSAALVAGAQQLPAAGAVAATSAATATATALLPATGTVAATTTATGATTARLPAAGTAAGTTTATGATTARLSASGTAAAVSGSSGAAGAATGPQQFPAAGTVAATSSASGTAGIRADASGSAGVISGSTAAVALSSPTIGQVAALATAAGQATLLLATGGRTDATSGASGAGEVILAPEVVVLTPDRLKARLRLPVAVGRVHPPATSSRARTPAAAGTLSDEGAP